MPRSFIPLLVSLILLCAAPVLPASAATPTLRVGDVGLMQTAAARRQGGEISLEEAVEQVRAETGGRILSAETVKSNGRRVHRIKVLTPDRRVRVVNVDAATGRR